MCSSAERPVSHYTWPSRRTSPRARTSPARCLSCKLPRVASRFGTSRSGSCRTATERTAFSQLAAGTGQFTVVATGTGSGKTECFLYPILDYCRARTGTGPDSRAARPGPRRPWPMHDETYKKLFAFPRMVEDLLRGFVAGRWIGEVDFSTLQKLSAEYVSDELVKRHGDAVWQVRLRERWLYLLVLLEFQSRDEPRMALRILTYTSLLYGELIRNGAVGAREPLPVVLPVVLYNGARAWRAAREVGELIAPVGPGLAPYQPSQRYCVVDERRLGEDDLPSRNLMTVIVQLERSRSLADLARLVQALRERLGDPGEQELRKAFVDWVRQAAERLAPRGAALPPVRTLEELKMTLVERVAEWPKQWIQEGLEQGLAHERALLRRLAALRFGAETAGQVSEMLERVADPERLAEAGEWLVRCDTGAELPARVARIAEVHDRGGSRTDVVD